MRTKKHLMIMVLAVIVVGGAGEAYGQKWKLASSTFATRQIRLHTAVLPKKFDGVRRIKLQALNAAVKVWDMTIHYKNGERQSVALPAMIYQGSETPVINLDEEGGIKMITFSLNAVTFSKKTANIWIWARE